MNIMHLKIITFILSLFLNFAVYAEEKNSIDDIIDSLGEADVEETTLITDNTSSSSSKNAEDDLFVYKSQAKMIILNKITAKSKIVDFKLGEVKYFGNISVEVQKCVKNLDPFRSSSAMVLRVFDNKPDEDRSLIFDGWVDSMNLSVSTVEHPVYEIFPKECVD